MSLAAALRRHWWRLLISGVWDFVDFTLGRIPVVGTIFDAIGGFVSLALWGGTGGLAFLEILDLSEQVDGFIPTLTLIGLYRLYAEA